ncbi:MAG: hypothetical protein QGG48_10060 [Desulfatiglandales bacterium]|jgi:hypothetical protein|nr:hypothetical protein [Desulfatiglandales bacterium]
MPKDKAKKAGETRAVKSHFDDPNIEESDNQSLPSDKAGRRKIKRNYKELLGIRLNKLRGQVLNREKINKSTEGIYYICAECKNVCHNLDEGLFRDESVKINFCDACTKSKRLKGLTAYK